MLLSQLTRALIQCQVVGDREIEFHEITADHRKVQPGSLFVAIRGTVHDGHEYIDLAVQAGACAVLVEQSRQGVSVPQLVVPDSRLACAVAADLIYGHPSHHLKVIGVTGTNGKTTVTHLIERILNEAKHRTGLIGTVGMRIAGETIDVGNTTPGTVDLQRAFARMVELDCQYCVMEVSSHALDQRRVAGTKFRTAVFTNLTQDHLDYHGTMDNYRAAKAKLFSGLGNAYFEAQSMSFGVVNVDDPSGRYMAEQTSVQCVTYGIDVEADVRAREVIVRPDGVQFQVETFAGDCQVRMPLSGRFNVYNALAAIAVGLIERIPLQTITRALETVPVVPGRFERVDAGQTFSVFVDYSHTPDSLDNALSTARQFAQGRVISVVGCGGDRDKTKRPIMARAAVKMSDLAIFTSDNPRTEDPNSILDDMEAGISDMGVRHERIADRREAIVRAIEVAQPGDFVLIAGKGHETYQDIQGVKHHFDDREVAREAILQRLSKQS